MDKREIDTYIERETNIQATLGYDNSPISFCK